jgi:hypothetical protein
VSVLIDYPFSAYPDNLGHWAQTLIPLFCTLFSGSWKEAVGDAPVTTLMFVNLERKSFEVHLPPPPRPFPKSGFQTEGFWREKENIQNTSLSTTDLWTQSFPREIGQSEERQNLGNLKKNQKPKKKGNLRNQDMEIMQQRFLNASEGYRP